MVYVIKRDNRRVLFNKDKIQSAIIKSSENNQVDLSIKEVKKIVDLVPNNVISKWKNYSYYPYCFFFLYHG